MKEIERKILWASIEDFPALWEISGEFKNIESELEIDFKIIRNALIKLLELEFVVLFSSQWGNENMTKVHSSEVSIIIHKDEFWQPVDFGEICYKIGNTQKGKEYYSNEN